MRVNKAKDYIERAAWTLIEFVAGVGIADKATGDPLSWWTPLFIGAVATAKILIAQRAGKHDDGAAIPGGVIEP
jgi:hypothetical protein